MGEEAMNAVKKSAEKSEKSLQIDKGIFLKFFNPYMVISS
jgi:hypothetical protein